MIACLDFNRFPQNSVEADSDIRDLRQLFNNIISDSVFSDFQRQLFINIKAYSNFSQFLSSILQLNKKSSAFRMVANKHKFIIKSKMPSTLQLIVGCKQLAQRKPQQFLVTVWLSNAISHHGPNHHESSCVKSRSEVQRHFKFVVASHSEGARFAPNFDRPSDLDSSKLIVIFLKISFHFCEDYRIFREGEYQVKNDGYAIDKQRSANICIGSVDCNSSVDCNVLVGRIDLNNLNGLVDQISIISLIGVGDLSLNSLVGSSASFARQLIGNIGLGISFIGLGFVGFICLGFFSLGGLINHNDLVGGSDLVDHIGLNFIDHNGLVSFIGLGIVGFAGLSLNRLGGIIGHISLVGRCIIGLIASSASVASLARRLIQLCQPHRLIDSSTVLQTSRHSRKQSNKNYMVGQASSSTRSCHLAIKRYRNCILNLLFHRLVLVASHAFAREGEDVVVASSCEEKDVVVDCLFW